MNRTTKIGAGVAAGAAALLAATAIAAAASPRTSDDTTPSPSTSSAPQGSSDSQGSTTPDQGSTEQARPKETPLTGTDAEKATAAAEAAVDGGTVIRVETDNDGVYEAHVRKSDGTEVVVKMDKDFTVTAVEEFQGRGGHDGADDDSSSSSSSALPAPSTSA